MTSGQLTGIGCAVVVGLSNTAWLVALIRTMLTRAEADGSASVLVCLLAANLLICAYLGLFLALGK
jgi:hypothetical protein